MSQEYRGSAPVMLVTIDGCPWLKIRLPDVAPPKRSRLRAHREFDTLSNCMPALELLSTSRINVVCLASKRQRRDDHYEERLLLKLVGSLVMLIALSPAVNATEGALGRPISGTSVTPSAGVVPPIPIWAANLGEIYSDGSIGGGRAVPIAGQTSLGKWEAPFR